MENKSCVDVLHMCQNYFCLPPSFTFFFSSQSWASTSTYSYSSTILVVLVLVLVLEGSVLVLVLVLEESVLVLILVLEGLVLEILVQIDKRSKVCHVFTLQSLPSAAEVVDESTNRKYIFPCVNNTKKSYIDDKSAILWKLDNFLLEKSDQPNLLFSENNIYPSLHQLGIKYFSVRATSARIERVLSCSGFDMRLHRVKLTSNNICILTFLKYNKDLFV